jgi:hypothetical protein
MADLNGQYLLVKLLNGADLSLAAQIAAGPLSADMSTMAIQSDGTLWLPSVGVVAADLSTVLVPSTASPTFTVVAALGPEDILVQASYSSYQAQFLVSRLTSGDSICASVQVPVMPDFRVLDAVWDQSGGALYIAALTQVDMQDGGSTVFRLDTATCALFSSETDSFIGVVESLILSPHYLVVNCFHGAGFQTISILDSSTLSPLSSFPIGDTGAGGGFALANSVLYLSCGNPPLLQAYTLPTGTVLWSYSLSLQGLKCVFSDLAIDQQGRIYASASASGYNCDDKGIYAFSPSGSFLFSSCDAAGAAAGCVAFGPSAIGADGELFAFAKTPVSSDPVFVYQPVKFFSAPSPGPSTGPSNTLRLSATALILAAAGGGGILCLVALAAWRRPRPACCSKASDDSYYSHLPSDEPGAMLVINDAPSTRFMASGGGLTPSRFMGSEGTNPRN